MSALDPDIKRLEDGIERAFSSMEGFSSLDLSIGELPCRIWLDDPRLLDEARRKYDAFPGVPGPSLELHIARSGLGEQRKFADALQSASIGGAHYVFRWDFSIRVVPEEGVLHAQLHFPSLGSVDSIVRIAYSVFGLFHDALLFHAASFESRGAGVAMVGGTGSGKSELSRKLSSDVLSDELTLIRRRDDELWIYGTPFHGQFATFRNRKARLRRLFAMVRGDSSPGDDGPLPERFGQKEAIRFLARHVFFFGDSPDLTERLLEHVSRLVARVPLEGFVFDPADDEQRLRDSIMPPG